MIFFGILKDAPDDACRRSAESGTSRAIGQPVFFRVVLGRAMLGLALMSTVSAGCSQGDSSPARLLYPMAITGPVVDDYGGTKVPDPYRWMEALDSKDVAAWVAAENAVTEPYLKSLPLRQPFATRLTALWNYPRVGLPDVV